MEQRIQSRKNPQITHLRKLISSGSYRKEAGEYLCQGTKLLESALEARAPIRTLYLREDLPCPSVPEGTQVVRLTQDVLESVSTQQSPQGVLFLVAEPQYALGETLEKGRYLVLDGVQDPGNVGTIWRSAQGLGADGLILCGDCANPWGHKVARSSMGACFTLPVYSTTPEELVALARRSGLPLFVTALDTDSLPWDQVDFSASLVVIGSEGQGVSPYFFQHCQQKIYLPMKQQCQSLNAAVAAGILLWEMGKS